MATKYLDRLTVFTFLWACQALVHQEFFSSWLDEGNNFGWLLTFTALAVLFNPRSLILFSVMLITSAVYNVLKWPFVVNHILVETVINVTMLSAICAVVVFKRGHESGSCNEQRDQIYDRFAPVVMWMLIVMYYFAFIAKLNYDFFDPELSCVAAMYDDLVRRIPFVPTDRWARVMAIWSTIVIEAAIPILLTFRRTKYLAIVIGMPFHLMLGLIGHRTFSALAFALYALFLMGPLASFVDDVSRRLVDRFGRTRLAQTGTVLKFAVVLSVASLIVADLTGHYKSGIGPIQLYRAAWVIWILWSLLIAAVYLCAMLWHYRRRDACVSVTSTARPILLWAILPLVILNGMSQYLGLKTESCFTMYSNLRTEGNVNNHMFMPALRLAGYQDDLVEVLHTDHQQLSEYVEKDLLITYFELRRVLSNTRQDCSVTFRHNGSVHVFEKKGVQATDAALMEQHPTWLAKLLYFRPVSKGPKMHCGH